MRCKSFGLFLSWVLLIGGTDTALSTPAVDASVPAVRNAKYPLPPAGPATIKQAQGTGLNNPLVGAAVAGGIFLAALLLINDDANGPTTTSTAGTH